MNTQTFVAHVFNRYLTGAYIQVTACNEEDAHDKIEQHLDTIGLWELDCQCGSCDVSNWVFVDTLEDFQAEPDTSDVVFFATI